MWIQRFNSELSLRGADSIHPVQVAAGDRLWLPIEFADTQFAAQFSKTQVVLRITQLNHLAMVGYFADFNILENLTNRVDFNYTYLVIY
jgi:hypothetical protein